MSSWQGRDDVGDASRPMRGTDFPTKPCEVVPLSASEFTSELDPNAAVSFDCVCRRFPGDTNRALVWFIRFRALTAWRERTDMAMWLKAGPSRAADACAVAASFALNQDWQFDVEAFRSAVEALARGFRGSARP